MGKKKLLICRICQHNITKTQYSIQCNGDCKSWFHQGCCGLTEKEFKLHQRGTIKWSCNECEADTDGSSDADETGARHIKRKSTQLSSESTELLFTMENPTNKEILTAMKAMFEDLKNSVSFNGGMIEKLRSEMEIVIDVNKKLKQEQSVLKNRINELEQEIIHIKRSTVKDGDNDSAKNIVVVGISGNDDSRKDVKKIFNYLNLNISDEEYRVKVLPSKHVRKPVLITFDKTESRAKVLEQKKSVRLDTTKCGISDTFSHIFVNEDMPRHTRDLFKKARNLKDHGYKYIWCKDGKILVRKTDGEAAVRIFTASQITGLMTS